MPLKHWQAWGIDHLSRKPVPVFDLSDTEVLWPKWSRRRGHSWRQAGWKEEIWQCESSSHRDYLDRLEVLDTYTHIFTGQQGFSASSCNMFGLVLCSSQGWMQPRFGYGDCLSVQWLACHVTGSTPYQEVLMGSHSLHHCWDKST